MKKVAFGCFLACGLLCNTAAWSQQRPSTSTAKTTPKPTKTTVQPGNKLAVITLNNPSFEDYPRSGEVGGEPPRGWFDCSSASGKTAPDVQPGQFGVFKPAKHGSTYLGLVVRQDESWEGVGQKLSQPLAAGKCYEWDLDLCRAEEYKSLVNETGPLVSFGSPVQVRIWGGNSYCERAELLYTTPYVVNTTWKGYTMVLKPKASYNYIVVEAFFKTPNPFPYNGNVLIDNAATIRQIECEEKKQEPIVQAPAKPKKTNPPPQTTKTTPAPPKPPVVQAPPPRSVDKVDAAKLKKGDVLQISNLYFDADKSDIKYESESTLNTLYELMSRNPKIVIEIGGHTNNQLGTERANTLSNDRAKAVSDWLVAKGIPANRIQFKGYGKTQPLVPNDTPVNKKKNQRVEVKILSVTG
jgi:outer membrane protein OmpA-like peptidoglycan-associated protein